MLGNTETDLIAMKNGQNVSWSYINVRKIVLHCFNSFSKFVECASSDGKRKLDVLKTKTGSYWMRFIANNGLFGMLKASDQEVTDLVLLSTGPIADIICGSGERPDMTKLFTVYAGVLIFLRRDHGPTSWSGDELESLCKMQLECETLGQFVYEKCHCLGTHARKWHLLDQVTDAFWWNRQNRVST